MWKIKTVIDTLVLRESIRVRHLCPRICAAVVCIYCMSVKLRGITPLSFVRFVTLVVL